MHRKHVVAIVILLFVCAAASIVLLDRFNKQRDLIFTLFVPKLQKASDDFYSEYLSHNPTVANYSGEVIGFRRDEKGYYIKFAIQPYIGPHYPVGDDEVEYLVSNGGSIALLRFFHKKNYELPARLGVTIYKPIPVSG